MQSQPQPHRPATEKLRERLSSDAAVCPNCRYNLKQLTDIRCPECGYVLAVELLDSPAPVPPQSRLVRTILGILAIIALIGAAGMLARVAVILPGVIPVRAFDWLRLSFLALPILVYALWAFRTRRWRDGTPTQLRLIDTMAVIISLLALLNAIL